MDNFGKAAFTHTSHHIHSFSPNFEHQRVSKFHANSMLSSDRPLELYRPSLNPGNDLFTNLFLAFGADDDRVVVAYTGV